jgi:YVTN family beta-propeller protein
MARSNQLFSRRSLVTQATSVGVAALAVLCVGGGVRAQQPAASTTLDFEYYRTRVQPIFTAKRPGHARCVSCHSAGTPLRLQPLAPGSTTWNEEDSRKNFQALQRVVNPKDPLTSRLLLHPLAQEAGGDLFHNGGKHWKSQNEPEWQTLAAWVRGQTASGGAQASASSNSASSTKVRIIQTNSAGDNVSIIDPVTNKVVGEITGIEVGHGAAAAPDGNRIYISNEADSTLDVVDGKTLKVIKKIPLSGHPNNIAIGRDGRRVFVGIAQAPGAVDIIDTASLSNAKSVPVKGAVHNAYVTPDGKYAVAGSIAGKNMTVIDTATEQVAWVVDFDLGVRPIAFEKNADGSTKRAFVQLSELNGFAVVDFATHKEVARIELPPLTAGRAPVRVGGNASHGLAVTADGTTLIVNSRLNSAVYSYSLPDLKLKGTTEIQGIDPNWVTLTPDSKMAYVAIAGSNFVSAIDIRSMKEVARIPVGEVPKRNITAMLP